MLLLARKGLESSSDRFACSIARKRSAVSRLGSDILAFDTLTLIKAGQRIAASCLRCFLLLLQKIHVGAIQTLFCFFKLMPVMPELAAAHMADGTKRLFAALLGGMRGLKPGIVLLMLADLPMQFLPND